MRHHRARNVIVIPGIMGSELTVYEPSGATVVWLSLYHIYRGWLPRLRLDPTGRRPVESGSEVRASNFLPRYYGELIRHLQRSWTVCTSWYDWRKDLRDLAIRLQEFIRQEFSDSPVSIVAHSMGGLIARHLFGLPGNANLVPRLVMLGTPNHGTFEAPQVLAGIQDTVRRLILLSGGVGGMFDPVGARATVLQVVSSFPSVYQLLPSPTDSSIEPLYNPATYTRFNPAVSPLHLATACERHESLRSVIDPDVMVSVAGCDQPTTVGIRDYNRLDDMRSYVFDYSGDGRVPHSLGLLDGVRTLFVRRSHGELPTCPEVLAVIDDLLERGGDAVPPQRVIERSLRRSPSEAAREWFARRAREDWEFPRLLRHIGPAERRLTGLLLGGFLP